MTWGALRRMNYWKSCDWVDLEKPGTILWSCVGCGCGNLWTNGTESPLYGHANAASASGRPIPWEHRVWHRPKSFTSPEEEEFRCSWLRTSHHFGECASQSAPLHWSRWRCQTGAWGRRPIIYNSHLFPINNYAISNCKLTVTSTFSEYGNAETVTIHTERTGCYRWLQRRFMSKRTIIVRGNLHWRSSGEKCPPSGRESDDRYFRQQVFSQMCTRKCLTRGWKKVHEPFLYHLCHISQSLTFYRYTSFESPWRVLRASLEKRRRLRSCIGWCILDVVEASHCKNTIRNEASNATGYRACSWEKHLKASKRRNVGA